MKYCAVSHNVNSSLIDLPLSLLWSRPPGTVPLKLRSHLSIQSIVVSILLLSGDIESNPGPAVSTVPSTHHVSGLNVGCINAYSALNKAALLHNTIDECELNIRFVTETGIKTRIWMQLSLFLLHLDSPFYTFISQLTVLSVVVELLSSLVTNWVSKMSVYRGNISHPPYWRHNALQKLAD